MSPVKSCAKNKEKLVNKCLAFSPPGTICMKTLSHTSYRKSEIPVSSGYEWCHLINFCNIKEKWVNAWWDTAVPPPVVARRGGQRHVTNKPLETSCFPCLAISLHARQKRRRGWARARQSVTRETPSWGSKIEALITLLTRTSQQFTPSTRLDCIQIIAEVKCVSLWGKARVVLSGIKIFIKE